MMNFLVYNTIQSFSEDAVWNMLIQFFIILGALILGNIIRRKVPLINKSLIPSALIGGLIIFILKCFNFFKTYINQELMEIVTYHALALGFIAITLKTNVKRDKTNSIKIVETGAITASTYIIQGIFGLGISIILFFVADLFYASGILLPLGFGQGPGQALNFGKLFETEYGFNGGTSFGLSIAAIGFIVASLVGVIYMNILKSKGKLNTYTIEESKKNTLEDYERGGEIPNTESVDKLSVQFSFVLVIYGFAYLLMKLISAIDLGDFGINTVQPLVWGFNFLWAVLFATIFKKILSKLKEHKVMNRYYTNNYLLDRISGLMFDVMIVAGTAAIEFDQIKSLLLPLVIICTIGAIVTFIFVRIVCKEIYPEYENEAFFAMFGMLTGTASNGMILLREIDPKFETPAAENLVLQNFPAIIFGFPVLLLINFAAKSVNSAIIALIIFTVIFGIFVAFLFRRKIFKKTKS